jgi:ketosteroid isomerase-like protein
LIGKAGTVILKHARWFRRIWNELGRFAAGHDQPRHFVWQAAHSSHGYRHRELPRSAPVQSAQTNEKAMSDDNLHIACACYQAYADKDRATLETLISDDFHFTSPLDNRIDRTTYFERCWPNNRTIRGYDFVHLAAEGDCVFITYEAESTTGRRFRNTEVMTIRNGRITNVEVFFGWNVPHEAKIGGFVDKAT